MQNKRTLMKVGCGAVAASAIVAGVIFEIQSQSAVSQFNSDGQMSHKDYEFMNYVSKYGKSYATKTEYKQRAQNWAEADQAIGKCNSEQTTQKCGHNNLSDLSMTEKGNMRGFKLGASNGGTDESISSSPPTTNQKDWVAEGKVTPIQNQGQCGGCWSFSASGCISSARAIAGQDPSPIDYSEQQLIDCDTGCNGCNGGFMDYAFEYVMSHPLETSADYPYEAKKTNCRYSAQQGKGSITGYKNVPKNSVNALKNAILKQPVSIAVDASSDLFQYYTSGVVTSTSCGTSLDHGILAVGYGTENGSEYFLVKNQWGQWWGDGGYIKIGAQEGTNICGITSYPSFVTV